MLTWEDADSTSSHRHTKICNYTMDQFPLKKTQKLAKTLLNKGLKDNINMGRESQRCSLTQNLTSGTASRRHKRPHTCGTSPRGAGLWPISGTPNLTTCTGEMSSQYFGFENQQGGCSENAKRLKGLKNCSCWSNSQL